MRREKTHMGEGKRRKEKSYEMDRSFDTKTDCRQYDFFKLFLLGLFSLFDMENGIAAQYGIPCGKITTHWPGASAQDVEKTNQ